MRVTSAAVFQGQLREMGMDFGEIPEAQQVTVAKMRTVFQTEVKKAGDTDVAESGRASGRAELLANSGRRGIGRFPRKCKLRGPFG